MVGCTLNGTLPLVYKEFDVRQWPQSKLRFSECSRELFMTTVAWQSAPQFVSPILHFGIHEASTDSVQCHAPFLVSMDHGTSLDSFLSRPENLTLTMSEKRNLCLRLLGGLAALHAAGVFHGDIRAANAVLSPSRPDSLVYIDFGLSRREPADGRPDDGFRRHRWTSGTIGASAAAPGSTPPVPTPTPADANDPAGLVAARTAFIEQAERARDVLKDAKHRKWAKAVAKYALGGESVRFFAEDDAGKLAKIITALKNDFDANGLVLDVFDLSNTAREVHPAVNGVLYDTLAHIVAEGSAAEMFLEGAGDSSERDGRRALIDLAKGCIPVGFMTSHMEEYMAIRYEAKVDPRKALTLEHRLVKENTTPGWFPDEDSRKQAMVERLDPEFYRALLDKYPLEADLAKVSLRELVHQITAVYISWATRLQRVHGVTFTPGDGVTGALVATEDAGGGDEIENDANKILLRQILERLNGGDEGGFGARGIGVPVPAGADQGAEAFAAAAEAYCAPEILSGELAGGLDLSAYGFAVEGQVDAGERDLRDPELLRLSREVDEAAARVCAESEAVAQRGRQAQADARERAVQESLAARERSVTAALAAQGRDAEELFMPVTWRPNGEKKNEKQQAVVPARCSEAAPQPVGCGTPPFGASQRLMSDRVHAQHVLDVLTAGVRQAVLPADGSAAAAGGELAAGGAGTYEIYDDNAAGFGDEDEYED
ncbi:hypothetical protein CYMTET_43017 [Cymbomonas tetramitiformis]|uniref:Protein kinase domain-containing protein n=1 Tax=Cymbomonas tetramitiformis TaxID=36881 RepID=A0AAE0C2W7_9CHLO|nr:hypothetical protein CYMTET_43017 [Cymbomonas tetramitiformis]